MDFTKMTIEELQARNAEIAEQAKEMLDNAIEIENEAVEALNEEARGINAELERRAAEEAKRVELRKLVASGKVGTEIEKSPEMEERKSMDVKEIRSSKEYAQAFLDAWRSGDKNYAECRALLTTNTTGTGLTGYVPVPEMLETEIKTAWESHRLIELVAKSNFKGNVKVGFELTATGASIHVEGTDRPDEEIITLGAVEIKAEMIKKWIRVSDEALNGTTVDTVGYLYREIAHRIVEKAEEVIITKITEAPAVASATAVGVPSVDVAELAIDTILSAVAQLSGAAQNLHIVMNRGTYAAIKAISLKSSYGADAFNGLEDRIIFTDKLDAFAAASGAFAIIGDFSAVQANFPNGNGVEIIVDPYTDAESDLVKIVGKQYVGFGIVKDKHLVVLKKGSASNNG